MQRAALDATHHQSVALELETHGISIHDRTVSRLLKARGFALRVNHKKLSKTNHPDRDQQFRLIATLRKRAVDADLPTISVDTKKKELIGRFCNSGKRWGRIPELVYDHDFRSDADGIAIPYGLYDLRKNTGAFYVGQSHDTPEFAVDCIVVWWRDLGRQQYPNARELCRFADSGGSNGYRPRAWKYFLQCSRTL